MSTVEEQLPLLPQDSEQEKTSTNAKEFENKEQDLDNTNSFHEQRLSYKDSLTVQINDQSHSLFYLIMSTLINLIICFFAVYPIYVIYAIYAVFRMLFRKQFTEFFAVTLVLICSAATIYMLIMTIVYINSEKLYKYWFIDALIFFSMTMLIISYIKSVHDNKETSSMKTIFYFMKLRLITLLNSIFFVEISTNFYSFDCALLFSYDFRKAFDQFMIKNGIQEISLRFNRFYIEYKSFKLKHRANEWLQQTMEKFILFNNIQLAVLLAIVLIKAIFTIIYLNIHHVKFDFETLAHINITSIFYIFTTVILFRVLGSYDLKRRTQMMKELNDRIDYRTKCKIEDVELGESELVNITCSTSIESWDNARLYINKSFNDILQSLELVYLCLFFYYLFLFLVLISAYGKFYGLFDEGSFCLEPCMVIQFSTDFVFLSALLFFRIWEGQQFNQTFEETDDNLDYLIDITDDLLQMYDYHFIPKQQQLFHDITEEKLISNHETSVYGLIVLHIQNKAETYIKRGATFLGEVYDQEDSNKLKQQMLKNMKASLKKVKRQLRLDSKHNCYRFLGLFKVPFNETFTVFIIAFVALLPKIIPQITDIFNDK